MEDNIVIFSINKKSKSVR